MLVIVYGSTAELIKMAPLMRGLSERGVPWRSWCTAQHARGAIEAVCDQFEVARPDRWAVTSAKSTPLVTKKQALHWFKDCFVWLVRNRSVLTRELHAGGTKPLVLVHGDTFTTVVGTLMGRFLGARVGHVEAGMRSGSLLSPFPEEADRRIVGRLADLHFAPTEVEARHLRRARGAVVVTGTNTALDALRMGLDRAGKTPDLPASYTLLTLHRFELLSDTAAFTAIVTTMHTYSRTHPTVWVMGNTERAKLEAVGLTHLLDDRLIAYPKCAYVDFLPIVSGAKAIVTDSGGLQQEATYLGIPLAIHRTRTETNQHRAGKDFMLTGMKTENLEAFLTDPERFRRPSQLDEHHPTETILTALDALGYTR